MASFDLQYTSLGLTTLVWMTITVECDISCGNLTHQTRTPHLKYGVDLYNVCDVLCIHEIFKAYKILQMAQIDDFYDFIFEDCPSNYFVDFALSS